MQQQERASAEQLTDADLVRLSADGGEAFSVLMQRYMPSIQKIASQYGGISGLEIADLIQEGLLGLLAAMRAYDEASGAFSHFAGVCIRNRIVSAVRKYIPQSEHETADGDDTLDVLPSGQADPAVLVAEREDARHLYKRLQQTLTPLEYRVLCGFLAGKTYKEIAEELSVSTKAVDNAMRRVRRKFRQFR